MAPLRAALAAFLMLSACARPLTPTEADFAAATLPGLDADATRLHRGPSLSLIPLSRPPRPGTACQDRIGPPEGEARVRVVIGGFVWRNRVIAAGRFFSPDYLPDYPEQLPLAEAMFLAHELTHVWQWQAREMTGYTAWRAVAEHRASDDPYRFTLDPGRAFLDYGYEQQAALVEEFVCCRALDPNGARTEDLHRLLAPHFPGLARAPLVRRVALVKHRDTEGICSEP